MELASKVGFEFDPDPGISIFPAFAASGFMLRRAECILPIFYNYHRG